MRVRFSRCVEFMPRQLVGSLPKIPPNATALVGFENPGLDSGYAEHEQHRELISVGRWV